MKLLRRRAPAILVLGGGPVGKRHARTLNAAGARVEVSDPSMERARATAPSHAVPFDLAHLSGYDGIVVASPASAHLDQTLAAIDTGARVLVEQPVGLHSAGTEMIAEAADQVMMGFNLRFHPPVAKIVELAKRGRAGRITAVRIWYGGYLPDRRPTVDYRDTPSARAELGGGALLDAMHELDLLIWLLGGPFKVLGADMSRLGDLDINVEDTVRTLLRHPSGVLVELSFDYLSRRYRRGIEIIGTDATLRLDWGREVLEIEAEGETEVEPAIDSLGCSYERQAERFVAWVCDEATPPVNGSEGLASLRLADQIREACGP